MKSFFRFFFSVRTIVLLLLVAALAGGGWYLWQLSTSNGGKAEYRTESVKKGNLSATITATGTLEPQQVIDVGAQVAGLVLKFAPADPANPNGPVVDYCTVVKSGQPLAYIDPTIYQAQVNQATAALGVANANRASAKANLKKAEAVAAGAKDAYQRDMGAGTSAINAGQIATDRAGFESAEADIAVQQAAVDQAAAAVDQATSTLKVAQTNLDYCTVKAPPADPKVLPAIASRVLSLMASPAGGGGLLAASVVVPDDTKYTILDRRVSIGQTVVASLSAPSLFLLAKDLMKMQIWASVNEADVGNIHKGEKVTFTVDARPGKTFEGTVSQIRLNASMTQNVVTYTVVVDTDNRWIDAPALSQGGGRKSPGNGEKKTASGRPGAPHTPSTADETPAAAPDKELELLPYLTGNLTFHVARHEDVLQVPNAALRWRPQSDKVDPKYRDEYEKSLRRKANKESTDADSADASKGGQAAPGSGDNQQAGARQRQAGAANRGMVWVQDGAYVRPIKIVTGLTDGAMTEVASVEEGQTIDETTELVTGENTGKAAAAATNNPFAPKLPFGQQPKKPDDNSKDQQK